MRIEITTKQFEDAMDFAHNASRIQMQVCQHITTNIDILLVDIDMESYTTLKKWGIL